MELNAHSYTHYTASYTAAGRGHCCEHVPSSCLTWLLLYKSSCWRRHGHAVWVYLGGLDSHAALRSCASGMHSSVSSLSAGEGML